VGDEASEATSRSGHHGDRELLVSAALGRHRLYPLDCGPTEVVGDSAAAGRAGPV
jgi:hypothetical protein